MCLLSGSPGAVGDCGSGGGSGLGGGSVQTVPVAEVQAATSVSGWWTSLRGSGPRFISSRLLGTREWFVIHRTDCGMEFFTDVVMRGLLANSLKTPALGPDGFTDVGAGPSSGSGSAEGNDIDWLTIADNAQSVPDDVTRIRDHPLVPASTPIHGYLYDVRTGRLIEVSAATEAGLAR